MLSRLWPLLLPAAAYQLLAIFAGVRQFSRKQRDTGYRPAVSVLKPIRGLDPNTYEAFLSQARQDYPDFEIVFGVQDPADPAIPAIQQLQRDFPHASIRLIRCTTVAPNGKVGTLIELSRHARNPVWIVNDSDIKVTPDYISSVVAPLADRCIGVVTCPYRASAHSSASAWEAFGIASDFMPSTLVAQLLGVREFGLGSTLAFHADDLKSAGGFEPLSDYLADDFQLAKRICDGGKRALLSSYVVETSLGEGTWRGIWLHQIRWARTIKASKGAGYLGLPFTHAGLWALAALIGGAWPLTLALLVLRMASALVTGWGFLRSPIARRFFFLAPLWDLYAFAIWCSSYAGRTVRWRDRTLTISRDGRIT